MFLKGENKLEIDTSTEMNQPNLSVRIKSLKNACGIIPSCKFKTRQN